MFSAEFSDAELARIRRAGIRIVESEHLALFTDLPSSPAVDELPTVFDTAVPQWAAYFNIPIEQVKPWKMQAFLIQDRAKFAALGLLPKQQPNFRNGFATAEALWLVEQPSDYYRRHLLLHEGTHGFMHALVGGVGPGWYMEGMAELFGTHSWQNGKLQMRTMPANRAAAPMWGRVKLIREAYQAGEALSLPAVLNLDGRRALNTAQYAWCWALCKFLDSHPRWQEPFRQLPAFVRERKFNDRFRKLFSDEWPELAVEWQALIMDLDYGYDFENMAMVHRAASKHDTEATLIVLDAKPSWQSTGWQLSAGEKYEIVATGRYIIAQRKHAWPCEPGGVTLEYHGGHPLGKLLGAWRSNQGKFSEPFAIGLQATLKPKQDAVLYLRVNDSPAERSDNQGKLSASISPVVSAAD